MTNGLDVSEYTDAPKTFLIEALLGISIFLIIGAAAVALSYLVVFLEDHRIDKVIIYGLKSAEYVIFAIDLILFSRFLWLTFCRTWRKFK